MAQDPVVMAKLILLPLAVGAVTGALVTSVIALGLFARRSSVHPLEEMLPPRWPESPERTALAFAGTVGLGAAVGGLLLLSVGATFWHAPPGTSIRWTGMVAVALAHAAAFPAVALVVGRPPGEDRDRVVTAWSVLGLVHAAGVFVLGTVFLAVAYVALFGFGFH
jgi:hypothetical protein